MTQRFWQWLFRYRFIVLVGFLALVVVSAGAVWIFRSLHPNTSQGQVIPVKNNPSNGSTSVSSGVTGISSGETQPISIHLKEGQSQPQAVTPVAVATGQPLSEGELNQLLARLPEMTALPEDQTDFRLAQQPIPPPRTGETIQQPFPAPTTAAVPGAVESGPLKVLRFAPEGEISIAPFVNVTFNQPMVAVATISDLAAAEVPVKMEPALLGTWRWLGTRTLTFEYDSTLIDRLPKATSYHITVPAGTKSATGGTLEASVEWSFTTPPPKITSSYPDSSTPQPREPLFFIHFDQRIDPAAVLQTIQVTGGGQKASLALVDEAALQADEKYKWLLKGAQAGRWLAFKVKEPLPADTDVQVTVGPNTPSAEGPLTTTEAQSFSFHTYAPLKIEDHGCSWGNNSCPPLAPLYIRFNNPIDTKTYSESMIRIDPELPGASVNIYGNTINIQGATKGQTTYTVTVDANIQDTFGQTLGQAARLTFKIGPAESRLVGPDQSFVTLDPAAKKPVFSVYTINYTKLDLKIYAVQPSDYPAFRKYMQDYQRTDASAKMPGKQVLSKTIPVEAAADTLTEVNIDLSEVLNGTSFGHFIVVVAPPTGLFKNNQDAYYQTVHAWVQVTQIGLDALTDQSDMVAWTTALKDGSPLANIKIKAESGAEVTTSTDGTARFPIPGNSSYLVAAQGADQAILPHSTYFWDEQGWTTQPVSDELRWFIYDDRQMYKPGEEVHVKGWLRRIGGRQDGDVGPVGSAVSGVNYQITDAQGNAIANGRADVNALGGFDFALTLPKAVNLGYASMILNAEGSLDGMSVQQCYHNFQIQEFRRPEFEVTARNESSGPYFAGESATLAVDAKYYAGGGLPNADVTWQVSSSDSQYAPPNWPDFTFGTWVPWWGYGGRGGKGGVGVMAPTDIIYGPGGMGQTKMETFTGKTDANGTHYLQLDFGSEGGPHPVSIIAEASVMDVNRQAWAGTTTLLVHPANLYVGLRSDRLFVQKGTPLKIEFIVTDLDGKAVSDRQVQIQAARLEWKYKDGQWAEEEVDPQQCLQGSTDKPGTCTFNTPLGGTYRITAVVTDDQGRKNQSQLTRWVSGGSRPPEREVKLEELTLIPDKQKYQPGDVAEILVQAPFTTGEGLLTITRSGIVSTERFNLKDGSATLKIPIEERYIPNLNIQVDVNGSAQRTDDAGNLLADVPARPAYATGTLMLDIPPLQRTLEVKLTPEQSELEPGGETTLAVQVNDAQGQPVSGAEMSVVVVDESILALTNYQMADPLAAFYANRPSYLQSVYARASIVLVNPLALNQNTAVPAAAPQAMGKAARDSANSAMESAAGAAPAAAMPMATQTASYAMADQAAAPGSAGQPIKVRSDFNPLAVFAPSVRTDANGAASVTIKLPDNLTRYRVMVVAVDEARKFGQAETNLTARLPLMVRPSAPRFLNFGDTFELPVVLQNQTDQPMDVNVAVRGTNIELTGAGGLRVSVPARDRIEVRFPASAQMAGTARFQIAATAGAFADAATVELPVYTPATTEAFATYGVVDQGAVAQPVASPQGVFPQYGGLEITTSSTALQSLTDAVLYLVSYPYECSEQLSSRILAVASLRDVLTAFKAEGLPSPTEMESAVDRDLKLLQTIQNDDGGFPYWRKGQDSIPFNTIHVAHALYQAKAKGFSVPEDMQQRTLAYLRAIENYYPSWYGQNTRDTLSAYALYVRHLMGDSDPDKALRLYNEAGTDRLSLDAIGWLWPVLKASPNAAQQVEAIRTFVTNHAVETAGAANFTTSYDDQNYLLLGSNRRTDAILLDALISDNPQHDLIPKVVNGLMAHRTKGHWLNTQEDVFVLLALDRYFNTFEAETPNFVAQIWLGQTYAGSHEYRGRTTERQQTDVPMSYLVDPAQGGGGTQNLILSKDGPGRLYYRLGLRYAPSSLKMDALDMGFIVQRTYEAVDNKDDVTRDADGTWHIKAGAKVRVHLTMVANNRRYHVALVDPLPAGLEIVNPALAVSGSVPQDTTSSQAKYGWWWWGTWYEHQNMRDERAEAFTSLLWDGVYQYSYVARATTPGTFVAPPAKAEEMYSPEVFGRSASDIVIVK